MRKQSGVSMRWGRWLGVAATWGLVTWPGCSDDMGSNDPPADATTVPSDDTGAGTADTSPGEDTGGPGGPDATVTEGPTWHGDVRAIMARHCIGCHVVGGPAPFDAADYAAVKTWGAAVVADLENGTMPPFPADVVTCRTYDGQNVVSEADKALVAEWVATGAAEGDPADYVAPDLGTDEVDPGPPDFTLASATPYTPDDPDGDDLRCIPIGDVFAEDTDIERLVIDPDADPIVHHVLIFEVAAGAAEALADADAADPGVGYQCDSGPGVPARNLGGWVPGGGLGLMPKDTVVRIAKGSRLILQMHYNTLFAPPEPDATALQMWRSKGTPKWLLELKGNAHIGIDIPAGDAASVESKSFPILAPTRVVGILGHMHKLATAMKVTVEGDAADGCLLHIPRWDYDWQRSYLFEEGSAVELQPGDAVHMECTFDNSAAHQPYIGGVQPEPIDVVWGEGTRDEMCLHYLMVQRPYTPPSGDDAGACPAFESCFEACRGGGSGLTRCAVECASPKACRDCLVPGLLECFGENGCASQVAAVTACSKGKSLAQIASGCTAELSALDSCAAPKIAACDGTCDVNLLD